AVSFPKDEADATVHFQAKGTTDPGAGMQMKYVLEQKGDDWVVKGRSDMGGGPAGSFAAERLARAGLETILLDEKLAWEKPCGGGITYKAYQQYPFLMHNDTPKKVVTTTSIAAPKAGAVDMPLSQPLLIYSRYDLNGMLLRRAEAAGAEIEKERVMGLDRNGSGWRIRTRSSRIDADYCVVATGARNPLRDVGTQYTAE